jgi:hypothetical protein
MVCSEHGVICCRSGHCIRGPGHTRKLAQRTWDPILKTFLRGRLYHRELPIHLWQHFDSVLEINIELIIFGLALDVQAGDLSGQVVEIGLHSTEMLNRDKFPTIVPNSFFSSQVLESLCFS